MGVLIRVLAGALLLLPAALEGQTRPAFVAQAGRVVAVVLPASVLADKEVQRQIGSGLTTTFVLIARQRDSDRRGAARIEIRFDLWDEVWIVRKIEFDGKEERQRITSRESLDAWWRAPVRMFAAATNRVPLNVTLTVLPFSPAEGADAREWISPEGGSPFVAALIGTTLNAKPIRSYRWPVDIRFK